MKIAILSNGPGNYSTKRLKEEALNRGHEVEIIKYRDMNIPLDILWLDKNREIIGIKQNVAPELGESKVFTPAKPARYVLELPAGSVKNSAIKMGDIAEFTLEGTGI